MTFSFRFPLCRRAKRVLLDKSWSKWLRKRLSTMEYNEFACLFSHFVEEYSKYNERYCFVLIINYIDLIFMRNFWSLWLRSWPKSISKISSKCTSSLRWWLVIYRKISFTVITDNLVFWIHMIVYWGITSNQMVKSSYFIGKSICV